MGPMHLARKLEKRKKLKKTHKTREPTKDALYAQRRLELANKYSNKKNIAAAEAKYGETAKKTQKVKYAYKEDGTANKYVMKNGRYVRSDIQ